MKNVLALFAAFLSLGYYFLIVYRAIDADGSWYNDLYQKHGRENVSFRHKLYYTVLSSDRRLSYKRTVFSLFALPLIAYLVVRLFVAGVMNF